MREMGCQLPFDFGGCGSVAVRPHARRGRREASVRLEEYAPFPRVRRDQRWRGAFTVDLSEGGACLRTEEAATVGSLFRAIVRRADGRPTRDSIARVAWCREIAPGDYRVGFAFVAARRHTPLRAGRTTTAQAA